MLTGSTVIMKGKLSFWEPFDNGLLYLDICELVKFF